MIAMTSQMWRCGRIQSKSTDLTLSLGIILVRINHFCGPENSRLIGTDAQDHPPSSCHVSYESDCGRGCIVSAIENMVRLALPIDPGAIVSNNSPL